ncbi:MAG: quinoprotein dehydrogenase-associated SoxYZ-like carrier [Gammaproteobacteria bacterium]|nr:quinoprotein dehydrogenase-associated SoxYZ-like carrier [Gammaproteobacteria bacterium]
MMNIPHSTVFGGLLGIANLLLMLAPAAGQATTVEEDMIWTGGLRQAYFGDRPITQSDDLIVLDVPKRAENAAIVPVSITARIPQTHERFIKTIYLIIDKNPGALAGKFHFTPKSGRADLAFRVRIDAYSPVRAIAETNDGQLYMSRRFVKASGGCSAPAGSDLDAAMARLGKIKLKTHGEGQLAEPVSAQLMISHPNLNGLQMDQLTRLYAPAHFVRYVKVSFEGEEVFSAETSFGISENPSFRFFFVPEGEGQLTAKVVDTKDLEFSQTLDVAAAGDQQLALD